VWAGWEKKSTFATHPCRNKNSSHVQALEWCVPGINFLEEFPNCNRIVVKWTALQLQGTSATTVLLENMSSASAFSQIPARL